MKKQQVSERRRERIYKKNFPKPLLYFRNDGEVMSKRQYVIKPKDYYAGKGVVCGLDCSEEEWLTELKKGIGSEKFLIQEFSNFTSRKLPVVVDGRFQFEEYKTTLGLFVYNGKLKGLYSRVGRENVIAGIVESITLPSLVYEERD